MLSDSRAIGWSTLCELAMAQRWGRDLKPVMVKLVGICSSEGSYPNGKQQDRSANGTRACRYAD